ncbi:MAG: hypothetical protein WC254_03435 [Candidatus Woesearchaeota archaeon]|jgi:hypothetical protein
MTMPDELKLVRIPLSGVVLFLYPEYVSQAQRFSDYDPNSQGSILGGTRGVHLIESKTGRYVAKPERANSYGLSHHLNLSELLKKYRSLTVKEVSVARALSLRATYLDDTLSIHFEKPYGYLEKDGRRVALFEYHEPIQNCPLSKSHYLIKLRTQINSGDMESRFDLKYLLSELAFPNMFAQHFWESNGIDHTEGPSKQGKYIKQGIPVIFVHDFELVEFLSDDHVCNGEAARREWRRNYVTPLEDSDRILELLPKKNADLNLEIILGAIERMEERFVAMPSVGPAQSLINAIANMQDISEVILT